MTKDEHERERRAFWDACYLLPLDYDQSCGVSEAECRAHAANTGLTERDKRWPAPVDCDRGAVGKWQPISTAPLDGTAVLVMRDNWPGAESGRAEECNAYNTYVAAWWPGERNGAGAWVCYMDSVFDPLCPIEPTHWMRLPNAPGEKP